MKVWIILVKFDLQVALCIKSKSTTYLIGPARISDIDRQIAALVLKDFDTRRHIIGKCPIINKLIV